ncbi:MAG TPA: alpha/beta hydrolase [Ktedonobacteraceae bacterium]
MPTTMTDKTIRLPDGRQLGYAEYGDPEGLPLLYFHGTPGSRLQGEVFDAPARGVEVRMVAPGRPGQGLSDFQPERTMLDWAHEVEALADHLHLERFAVMGISGGGPYAAATAYQLPERVTKLALISTVCPLSFPGATTGMLPAVRLAFRLARSAPWAVNLLMRNMDRNGNQPERARKRALSNRRVPPADIAMLEDDEFWKTLLANRREATRNGTRGVARDVVLCARPWGFQLEDIQVPTLLWHGEADVNAPVSMGRAIARIIPNCQATFVPGEGHLSLARKHMDEILRSIFSKDISVS